MLPALLSLSVRSTPNLTSPSHRCFAHKTWVGLERVCAFASLLIFTFRALCSLAALLYCSIAPVCPCELFVSHSPLQMTSKCLYRNRSRTIPTWMNVRLSHPTKTNALDVTLHMCTGSRHNTKLSTMLTAVHVCLDNLKTCPKHVTHSSTLHHALHPPSLPQTSKSCATTTVSRRGPESTATRPSKAGARAWSLKRRPWGSSCDTTGTCCASIASGTTPIVCMARSVASTSTTSCVTTPSRCANSTRRTPDAIRTRSFSRGSACRATS